jgi:hypothetical protein
MRMNIRLLSRSLEAAWNGGIVGGLRLFWPARQGLSLKMDRR